MMYTFKSYARAKDLFQSWKSIEDGREMTYFQRYEWYESMERSVPSLFLHPFWDIRYVELKRNDITLFIAPLLIIKNYCIRHYKKGIYILGFSGWNDYCNFIYESFDNEAFVFLLKQIYKATNIGDFFFHNLREDTSIYRFLSAQAEIKTISKDVCIGLKLPDSISSYMAILSKNVKQNIRTANNRILKDSLNFCMSYDDPNVIKYDFAKYRNQRLDVINRDNRISRFRVFVSKVLMYCFPFFYLKIDFYPFYDGVNSHFLTVKNSDNNDLCAAFCYGIQDSGQTAYLMAVSLNREYSRYSPGIYALYHWICYNIENKQLRFIDFTRGEEKYKYYLGGEEHFIYSLAYDISRL